MSHKNTFSENTNDTELMDELSTIYLDDVGKLYYLDVGLTKKFGPEAAFVLSYFAYHYLDFIQRKCNYRQNRYWVPVSLAKIEEYYPFLTRGILRTLLPRLEKARVFFVGNFNSRPGDKTKWYSLNERNIFVQKYLKVTKLRLEKKNKYSFGQNNQLQSQNNQAHGYNSQALGQNSQAFGENNQAIYNNNIINNNNFNNTSNQPKPTTKKRYSGLLPLT